ncbi:MAG TPA: zinc ribbon domain-containing protein [Candidatus Limnocylindrales bacterium]
MPVYEYRCTSCGHRTDILHGINEPGPKFCPSCGTEGSMRKVLSPPSIVFKGSGWARKDRGSTTKTKAAAKAESGSESKSESTSDSKSDSKAADSPKGSSSSSTSSVDD